MAQVGLGIAGDSVKVFKDYNVSTKAVEDLKYLAKRKLGGGLQNWGLASLTEKLICKQVIFLFFSAFHYSLLLLISTGSWKSQQNY